MTSFTEEVRRPQHSPEKSEALVFRKVKLYENKSNKCLRKRPQQTSYISDKC